MTEPHVCEFCAVTGEEVCAHCLRDRIASARADVIAEVVAWLRGRTGAHGGGFTSADDVADAIEREFGGTDD